MATDKTGLRLLAFFLLVVCACRAKNVTIDAAMSGDRYHFFFLIADGEIMIVHGDQEGEIVPISNFEIPADMKIRAGLQTNDPFKWLIYGDRYGLFIKSKEMEQGVDTKRLKYGRKRKFLQNGGPDAAARIGQTNYFFKGCEMAIRYSWRKWGEPEDVREYGLPCHIDAAFQLQLMTFFIRGDVMWIWHQNNTVTGPTPFSDVFKLNSWQLIPREEE